MAQELTTARSALSKVSSDLKRGQFISAATAVREGARLFGRIPMIKNEAEELSGLLQDACSHLRYDKEVAKLFPLALNYSPGKEDELVSLMNQLIEALQEASLEDAIKKHEEKKAAAVAKGRKLIAEEKFEEARQIFRQITEDYADDAELAAAAGEIFLQVNLFDEAYRFLAAAVKLSPNSAKILNKLGIVLRKMKKYEQAETIYKRAIALEPGDPNLFFNMARVFLDQSDFRAAVEFSQKALTLAPDFTEASKLKVYAVRKLEEQS